MKRIQLLPEGLQEALFSDRTTDAILKNCALRDIPLKQAYFVGTLARRVLLGYLRPELFAEEIRKETGVEEMTAQHIAHDLDMEIFSEVRLELKRLYPPTIQTPTVQSWMARENSPLPATSYQLQANSPLPATPKYVIPIPEKFQGKQFPGFAPSPSLPLPLPATSYKLPANSPLPATSYKLQATPAPSSPLTANSYQLPANFKPVVQLPTFIGSQPATEKPELGIMNHESRMGIQKPVVASPEVQPIGSTPLSATSYKLQANSPLQATSYKLQANSEDASKRLKEMIAKFSVSSTASPKAPEASPYKERVE